MMGPLPLWAEVAFAAVEDQTDGTMVVDGDHARHRPAGPGHGADHLDDRGRQGGQDRGRRGRSPAARGDRRRARTRRSSASSPSVSARWPRSARRPRRAGWAPCTARSATTTTPIRAARTCASCTSTASCSKPSMQIVDNGRWILKDGKWVAVTRGSARSALEDVEPIPLPGGSWSRMVLTDKSLSGNTASLGYSVFTPGLRDGDGVARDGRGGVRPVRVRGATPRRRERPVRRGRRACSSRPACGTPSRTPARRTWSWCSGSLTPTIRPPSGGARERRSQRRFRNPRPPTRTAAWLRRWRGRVGFWPCMATRISPSATSACAARTITRSTSSARASRWERSFRRTSLALDLRAGSSNGAEGMHLETVLHTEVYKRRPDVRSVVHGHPLYATAFGATDAEFAYLTHDSVLFVDGISTYDGVPDLIVNEQQGAAVAEALGAGSALLLRNHGVLGGRTRRRVGRCWPACCSSEPSSCRRSRRASDRCTRSRSELLEGIHAAKYQDEFRRASTGTRGSGPCAGAAGRSGCPGPDDGYRRHSQRPRRAREHRTE